MRLDEAKSHAFELTCLLSPYCSRMEVAGGVRREKPDPHDIELVVVPRLESEQLDMEGREIADSDCLQSFITSAVGSRSYPLGRAGADKAGKRAPLGPRCYRVLWRGEQVDIFAVLPPAQFGVILAARTGDASFTQSISGVARSMGMRFEQGRIVNSRGEVLQTPEETDVFKALGLPFVEPQRRSLLPSLPQIALSSKYLVSL